MDAMWFFNQTKGWKAFNKFTIIFGLKRDEKTRVHAFHNIHLVICRLKILPIKELFGLDLN